MRKRYLTAVSSAVGVSLFCFMTIESSQWVLSIVYGDGKSVNCAFSVLQYIKKKGYLLRTENLGYNKAMNKISVENVNRKEHNDRRKEPHPGRNSGPDKRD